MQNSTRFHRTASVHATSLKRTKAQFSRLSTKITAHQSQNRIQSKIKQAPIFRSSQLNQQSSIPLSFKDNKKNEYNLQSSRKHDAQPEQINSLIQQISSNITSQYITETKQLDTRHIRHNYYNGLDNIIQFDNIAIPQIVKQIYAQYFIKIYGKPPLSRQIGDDSRIHFEYGVLKEIGYIYYVIQTQLILIRIQHIVYKCINKYDSAIPYSRSRYPHHIYKIIVLTNFIKDGKQKNIIIFVCPWQLQLYEFKKLSPKFYLNSHQKQQFPFIDLNTTYQLPVQKVEGIQCSKDGSIYYMDKRACLYKINIQPQKIKGIFSTNRYTLKTYITPKSTLLNTKLDKIKASILKNLVSFIGEIAKNIFLCSYEVKQMLINNNQNFVYIVVVKKIETALYVGCETLIFCFNCSGLKPVLIHIISQKSLYDQIGSHLPKASMKDFQIHSIYIPNSGRYLQKKSLSIVMKSGICIYAKFMQNSVHLEQILYPPNLLMIPNSLNNFKDYCSTQFIKLAHNFGEKVSKKQKYAPKHNKNHLYEILNEDTRVYQVKQINCMSDKLLITLHENTSRKNMRIISIQNSSKNIDRSSFSKNCLIFQPQLNIMKQASSHSLNFYQLQLYNLLQHQKYTVPSSVKQLIKQSQERKNSQNYPIYQLVHSSNKLSIIAHMRYIDVLFTILFIKVQIKMTNNDLLFQMSDVIGMMLLDKDPFIGLNQTNTVYLGYCLMKLCFDQDGYYLFSPKLATQIISLEISKNNAKLDNNNTSRLFNTSERSQQQKIKERQKKLYDFLTIISKQSKLYTFKNISPQIFDQAKKLLKNFSENHHHSLEQYNCYSLQQTENILNTHNKHNRSIYKKNIILLYITKLFEYIWTCTLQNISKHDTCNYFINKLREINSMLHELQPYFKESQYEQHQSYFKNILFLVNLLTQLFLLIRQLKILPSNLEMGHCITKLYKYLQNTSSTDKQFQSSFDWLLMINIQKYFKKSIQVRWQKLFPLFMSKKIRCLISLKEQIEQKGYIIMNQQKQLDRILKVNCLTDNEGIPLFYVCEFLMKKCKIDGFTLGNQIKISHQQVYCEDGCYWNIDNFIKQNKNMKEQVSGLTFNGNLKIQRNKTESKNKQQVIKILKKYKHTNNLLSSKQVSNTKYQQQQLIDLHKIIYLIKTQQNTDDHLIVPLTIFDRLLLINMVKSTIPILIRSTYKNNVQNSSTILQQFNILSKIIIMQFQLHKHYQLKIQQCKNDGDPITQQLLKYNIVDEDKLQKLVLSFMDYKLSLVYYSIFIEKQRLIRQLKNSHYEDKSNQLKFGQIFRDFCEQFPSQNNYLFRKQDKNLQNFIQHYVQQMIFIIANKSRFCQIALKYQLTTIQKYLIHLQKPLQVQSNIVFNSDMFGIQKDIINLTLFNKSNLQASNNQINTSNIFKLVQMFLNVGYQPQAIFQQQMIGLHQVYTVIKSLSINNNVYYSEQVLYWYKWLNCYILLKQYFPISLNDTQDSQVTKLYYDENKVSSQVDKTIKRDEISQFTEITHKHLQTFKHLTKYKQIEIGAYIMLQQLQIHQK